MCNARIIIHTQNHENYGAHTWDGEGQCPQHWKAKGGDDIVVAVVDLTEATKGGTYLYETYVAPRVDEINEDNDYFTRVVIDWQLYFDGELTWLERSQLEDGELTYPAEDISGANWCPIWARAEVPVVDRWAA